jgi:hypothetical protein
MLAKISYCPRKYDAQTRGHEVCAGVGGRGGLGKKVGDFEDAKLRSFSSSSTGERSSRGCANVKVYNPASTSSLEKTVAEEKAPDTRFRHGLLQPQGDRLDGARAITSYRGGAPITITAHCLCSLSGEQRRDSLPAAFLELPRHEMQAR